MTSFSQLRAVGLSIILAWGWKRAAIALVAGALSALSMRLCGWRTEPNGAWKLRDLEWPLLKWSRYMISTHVVRVLVGTFFRASPKRWRG